MTRLPVRGAVLSTALALALGACAAEIRNHGYAPSPVEMSEIQVGVDTRGSVRRKIGRPGGTSVFTDDGWYYVASKVEHYLYNDPKVVDRRVVAILFDGNDVVTAVNAYGYEDGRVIDLETKVTPTYGRQLSILEQLLGNLNTVPADVFTTE